MSLSFACSHRRLMLVTHLKIEAKTTVEATVHVLSILRLPQAIDYGGSLVNALGSWLPCRVTCLSLLIIFMAKPEWALFVIRQQVLG